jgi:transposase
MQNDTSIVFDSRHDSTARLALLRWPNRVVEGSVHKIGCSSVIVVLERGRDGLATSTDGGAAMKKYAGLDVSMEETSICVIDGDGEVIAEGKVASEPGALARYLEAWREELVRIGLEAGATSPWLHRGLVDLGLPAVCIETRRMKAYAKASPVKTDRRDAHLIALAMRAGLFRAVHVKSEGSQKLRLALTARRTLLDQARQLQGKIRGDLKPFGIVLGKVGSGGFAARVKERLAGRADLWALVSPLLDMRGALLDRVRGYERLLRSAAKANPVVRRLMTAPGVGTLNALAYYAVIDTPERFRRSADVPAALGLTPRIDNSGEVERCGSITKAGDALLRSLLFEAANALLTRTRKWCALKRWGLTVAKRRGFNRARVAVARRLAIVLHRMWRDGTEFHWGAELASDKAA